MRKVGEDAGRVGKMWEVCGEIEVTTGSGCSPAICSGCAVPAIEASALGSGYPDTPPGPLPVIGDDGWIFQLSPPVSRVIDHVLFPNLLRLVVSIIH